MSRILVVEDEAHLAQGLRFNLEQEGHSVQVSGTGEDALDRLLKKKEEYDALVLDVMLPGKDGFIVAQTLRKEHNYIPLLILTARSRPEDVLLGFESGADDYLPKPFNLSILIARVGSLLRRKTWERAANQPPRTPRIKGLSRQERVQLAADLRLTAGKDEEEMPFVFPDEPNSPDKPNQ